MINVISPGEITKGIWIMPYESFAFQSSVNQMTGEQTVEKVPVYAAWFKGIPYKVSGVAGPIVAVETFGLQGAPPITFFDTRLVKFLEVEASYGENYVNSMRVKPEATQPVVFAMPSLFSGNTNG